MNRPSLRGAGFSPAGAPEVGDFGLAVKDVQRSGRFWTASFDLKRIFEFDGGVGLSNDNVTIALFEGESHPETFNTFRFICRTRTHCAMRSKYCNANGPESPGSRNIGLWFHDPHSYRWELSVQGRADK